MRDIVLVGHSFGGTVVARAAPRLGDRLKRMVFYNAFIPENGNSVLDEVPEAHSQLFRALAKASDDNSVMLPFPIWREAFIQDADLAFAQEMYDILSSQPLETFDTKLDFTEFYALQAPRSFLNCTDDTAMPPGEWGWHPRMSSRLGLHRLVQMPGSHESMLTSPELMAKKLIEAGRD
jgi:pimeloyl-ACP methyl ester carboxylesterase